MEFAYLIQGGQRLGSHLCPSPSLLGNPRLLRDGFTYVHEKLCANHASHFINDLGMKLYNDHVLPSRCIRARDLANAVPNVVPDRRNIKILTSDV